MLERLAADEGDCRGSMSVKRTWTKAAESAGDGLVDARDVLRDVGLLTGEVSLLAPMVTV